MSDATSGTVSSRPEIFNTVSTSGLGVVQQPLGVWERLIGFAAVRKSILLVLIALAWELYARWLGNSSFRPSSIRSPP